MHRRAHGIVREDREDREREDREGCGDRGTAQALSYAKFCAK